VQRKHRGLTKSGLNTAGKDQENEAIEKTWKNKKFESYVMTEYS
jgi:hypothetical protein